MKILLAAFVLVLVAAVVAARTADVRKPGTSVALSAVEGRTPVLVELFTSEGCSSCPPADQLLADLVQRQPVSNATILALGEHVDYWNDLGWRDPFSDALFTSRQNVYGRALRRPDIYTPQLVIDGNAEVVGSDRAAALAAIARAASAPTIPIALAWTPAHALDVTVAANSRDANADVWLAITEDGLVSAVTRGENAGHTLHHVAVTRRLTRIGETPPDGGFARSVPIALDRAWVRTATHVIVFVQERDARQIHGAAALNVPQF